MRACLLQALVSAGLAAYTGTRVFHVEQVYDQYLGTNRFLSPPTDNTPKSVVYESGVVRTPINPPKAIFFLVGEMLRADPLGASSAANGWVFNGGCSAFFMNPTIDWVVDATGAMVQVPLQVDPLKTKQSRLLNPGLVGPERCCWKTAYCEGANYVEGTKYYSVRIYTPDVVNDKNINKQFLPSPASQYIGYFQNPTRDIFTDYTQINLVDGMCTLCLKTNGTTTCPSGYYATTMLNYDQAGVNTANAQCLPCPAGTWNTCRDPIPGDGRNCFWCAPRPRFAPRALTPAPAGTSRARTRATSRSSWGPRSTGSARGRSPRATPASTRRAGSTTPTSSKSR